MTLSPAISQWQQSLQMLLSSLQPGIAFSTREHSLFCFPKSLVAKMAGGNGLQPLPSDSDSAFIPFTYMFAKQGKQFGHMVTYDGFGCRSDMFRCRFGCCSDPWVFQETSLYCQDADL